METAGRKPHRGRQRRSGSGFLLTREIIMYSKQVLALSDAKTIAAAAIAEAQRNNWNVVVAIVDDGGHL
ncbi:MAG TPA: heme-binding protein, partial [Beijerinckiaceae bacterium]